MKLLGETKTKTLVESNPVQVEYYNQLQNGSFESPIITDFSKIPLTTANGDWWWKNYSISSGMIRQIPDSTDGLIWKTTGNTHLVEIARKGTVDDELLVSAYGIKEENKVPDGEQFAEINSNAEGILYQDILTVPGETLNWSLWHRGRDGTDTMYVVAMATEYAEDANTSTNITSYSQVSTIIENADSYPGVYCYEITDDNTAWEYHTGSFVIPENQYLTRFFFVAGATGGNDVTQGNFIDDIKLSQDITRTPETGEITITVKKIIQNVPYSVTNVKNTKLDVSLTNITYTVAEDNKEENAISDKNIRLNTFAYGKTNTISGPTTCWYGTTTITLDNLKATSDLSINLSESNVANNFGNYYFSDAKYTLWNESSDVFPLTADTLGDNTSVVLSPGNNYTITIYNNYEKNTTTLVINKVNIFGTKLTGSAFKLFDSGRNFTAIIY
jgi:hypothetical protein